MEEWQKRYEMAARQYGWKGRLIKRCRDIKDSYANGEIITDDDDELLMWLVMRHPDACQKIGVGVDFFTVEDNAYNTRGFWVHRIDGTMTDFSLYACVTEPSHKSMVRDAMRVAVGDQVSEFKMSAAYRGLECAITGVVLSLETAHVDHAPPEFAVLADEWADDCGGYNAIDLMPEEDGKFGNELYSEDAEDWAEYHREYANLRIVSAHVNLSVLRRKR